MKKIVHKELIEFLNLVQRNYNQKTINIWGFEIDKDRVVDEFDMYLDGFGQRDPENDFEINEVINVEEIPEGYEEVRLGDGWESEEEINEEKENAKKEAIEDEIEFKAEVKSNKEKCRKLIELIKEMDFIWSLVGKLSKKEREERIAECSENLKEIIASNIERENLIESIKWGAAKEAIKHWKKVFKPLIIKEEKEVVEEVKKEEEIVIEVLAPAKEVVEEKMSEVEIEIKLNKLEKYMNEVDQVYLECINAIIKNKKMIRHLENLNSKMNSRERKVFGRMNNKTIKEYWKKICEIESYLNLKNPLWKFDQACLMEYLDPEKTRELLSERRGWSIVPKYLI